MTAPGHSSSFAGPARKRDLWWQFTIRAIETRHRGSYLGIIWTVLTPLLMLAVYAVVFGMIFRSHAPNESPADFVLQLFLGITFFQLLAETLSIAPLVIVGSPNLVKKVVFPLELLPLTQLGASAFYFLISLGLLFIGICFFGHGLPLLGLLWLPVILIPFLLLTTGLCWICAALGVFFRDLAQAMPFLTQVIFFSSMIQYRISFVTRPIWMILRWNPFLHTVDLARDALLWHAPINLLHLGYTYAAGLLMFFGGRWTFLKLQPAFADVL